MGYTRLELSKALGCTKQTIANQIKSLGLEGHVRRDGRADVIDDEAASILAAKICGPGAGPSREPAMRARPLESRAQPEPARDPDPYKEMCEDLRRDRDAMAARYEAQIDRLQAEVDSMRGMLAAERDETRRAEAEARRYREALVAVANAGVLRRGRVARDALALPAPRG